MQSHAPFHPDLGEPGDLIAVDKERGCTEENQLNL